jgi:hypothetical protein
VLASLTPPPLLERAFKSNPRSRVVAGNNAGESSARRMRASRIVEQPRCSVARPRLKEQERATDTIAWIVWISFSSYVCFSLETTLVRV